LKTLRNKNTYYPLELPTDIIDFYLKNYYNTILYSDDMGIKERLRKQREIENLMLDNEQQTVPEAIKNVLEPIIEEEIIEELDIVEPIIEEEIIDIVEPIIEEPVIEPVVEEELKQIVPGIYKITGIYKEGLEIYFNDFMIKPTQNYLQYGDKRIKGANNPFHILLNNKYEIYVTIDPYLIYISIGKLDILQKMINCSNISSNQPITIEQL
jgi:hypothetical protein